MNTYLLGCDILGEDIIPTVDKTYTDTATVTAVQRGLMASGYKLPKYGGTATTATRPPRRSASSRRTRASR